MDKETSTMGVGGFAFIALFLLILFALFNQNGLWGHGRAYAADSCGVSGCEIKQSIWNNEKQGIIDSARTNYNVEAQANITRETLGNKIDFYAMQNLRDELNQERAKSMYLQGQIDNNARFYALDTKLNEISCNMCRKPQLFCQSFTCDGTKIPSSTTTA